MAAALPFPWDAFGRLQAATDSPVVNAWNNARDEALTELLDELVAGVVWAGAGAIERRHRELTANRATKYRRRVRLEDQVAHHVRHQQPRQDQASRVELQELVALASERLPPADMELLHDVLGHGRSYREVASRVGKPIGTVKAQVSRLRRQIRDSRAGETIRLALAAA
jgi:DNA-binding NarL/FixJ family response regulator